MGSAKILFTLSCVAILATSLGDSYNMKRIGVCLQIACEATSAFAPRVMPLFQDLTQCLKFKSIMDLTSLSFLTFGMVVFSWLQSLALEVQCLWKIEDQLRLILGPHWHRYNQYECMYLGLSPQCIPK